ncbi:MAG: hypothetical protein U5L45_09025 [Saprospiraceae bacterium]|nr:hypothetical protein [Saprospiraceae bacterium]
MVRFSASPKNEPFSPSRERSEREMPKTLLDYAHSSLSNYQKVYNFLEVLNNKRQCSKKKFRQTVRNPLLRWHLWRLSR